MRRVAVVAAVVALFGVGAYEVVFGGIEEGPQAIRDLIGDEPPAAEYSTATERVFLRTCTEGDEGLSEELCSCTYERITRTIPFDEYAEIDQQVRDDPDALPDRIAAIAAACAARIVSSAGGPGGG